jgi:hypothetical protein
MALRQMAASRRTSGARWTDSTTQALPPGTLAPAMPLGHQLPTAAGAIRTTVLGSQFSSRNQDRIVFEASFPLRASPPANGDRSAGVWSFRRTRAPNARQPALTATWCWKAPRTYTVEAFAQRVQSSANRSAPTEARVEEENNSQVRVRVCTTTLRSAARAPDQ